MKGGITSGIVYPGAVCELAKDYEFAHIGGTSAGAIAAALTAAAEARRKDGSEAGFEELARLPYWLAKDGRLLQLFVAQPETAPLFAVAIAGLEGGKPPSILRALWTQFHRCGGMVLAGGSLLIAIAIACAYALRGDPWLLTGALVLLLALLGVTAVAALAASAIEAVLALVRILPLNGFGIASGMSATGDALTQWLAAKIDEVAGATQPLTFGDLARRDIHLEVMTTNLTHGRPYRLPLETQKFYFAGSEMRRLFPAHIVQWMIDHARPETRRQQSDTGEELYPLPDAEFLPVVVATRMSLSFPILLSAVPLWSIDFGRRSERHVAERCWFSDGGITSNFPVHFFDKPLPRWPTFAFNLAQWTPRYHEQGQSVYAPRTNRGGILEWWAPIATLADFVGAIVNTMQNWRDNMLLHLPGQRDRIAHVLLESDEGGLNLTMKPETIARVAAKGAAAAGELRARFAGTPPPGVTLTWANHKWVRFLAFMPALEETLESWSRAFSDRTMPPSFDDLLAGGELPSYKVSPAERDAMRRASLAFLAHIHENFGSRTFRKPVRRPKPEPVLRAMPRE